MHKSLFDTWFRDDTVLNEMENWADSEVGPYGIAGHIKKGGPGWVQLSILTELDDESLTFSFQKKPEYIENARLSIN